MIIEFEIEVLWHTDETRPLDELGIDFDFADCEHRLMTFYRIDAISPNLGDGKDYCNIHSGGDKWISPNSYNFVKQALKGYYGLE
jgi:hypothetical protein